MEPRLFPRRHAWNLVPEEFRQRFGRPEAPWPHDKLLAPVDSVVLAAHSLCSLRLMRTRLAELHALASRYGGQLSLSPSFPASLPGDAASGGPKQTEWVPEVRVA